MGLMIGLAIWAVVAVVVLYAARRAGDRIARWTEWRLAAKNDDPLATMAMFERMNRRFSTWEIVRVTAWLKWPPHRRLVREDWDAAPPLVREYVETMFDDDNPPQER